MMRRLLPFLLLFLVGPSFIFAQTSGKIRGKVVDNETGEPLVGVSVSLEGTSFGASSDINGEYIILAVPVGTYTLDAKYIGYQEVSVSNVRVLNGLSVEQNFKMSSSAVQVNEVKIVAERPLVNKSMTNTESVLQASDIKNLSLRGVQAVVALTPGVTSDNNGIHFRGGRADEAQTYVDGVPVNNPVNQTQTLTVINNAIEEVSTQIGGMTAEYGNAMSGIINVTTKTGGSKYTASFEGYTDNLGGTGKQNFLGAYSYGLNQYVATLSGPLFPSSNKITFFLAGQHDFNRSGQSFLSGISFPTVDSTSIYNADWTPKYAGTDSGTYVASKGLTGNRSMLANLVNSVDYSGGRSVEGYYQDWALNGNLYFDLTPLNVKIGGSYAPDQGIGGYGKGLGIIYLADGLPNRNTLTQEHNASGYLKATYFLDATTYLVAQGNYWQYYQENMDPILKENIEAYGVPGPDNPGLIGPSLAPPGFTLYNPGWSVAFPADYATSAYSKLDREQYGGRLDFDKQFSKAYELKIGGEYDYYTIRTYSIDATEIAGLRNESPSASDYLIYLRAGLSNYGYDLYGNPFSGGTFTDKSGYTADLGDEGPRHPVLDGLYIQNKVEMSDFILNFGLRFDAFNSGAPMYKNPADIGLTPEQTIADTSLIPAATYTQVSPRVGFSFPVTDATVFHAEFGKFMEQSALSNYYDTRAVAGYYFSGGYARNFPNPNLKPERTTDYELGFSNVFSDVAEMDITGFYKNIRDLVVIRYQITDPNAPERSYFGYANGDFGTTTGLQFRFNLRRTNRIQLSANYSLQASTATGSTSISHFNIAWQDLSGPGSTPYFPTIVEPTDQDRTHSGNIILDYRFGENDGPSVFGSQILSQVGLDGIFYFSSGARYTLTQPYGNQGFSTVNGVTPYEALNQSEGPWSLRLDLKLDKAFNVGSLSFDVYLWAQNVLDRKNILSANDVISGRAGLYTGTGSATDDGWLGTSAGQSWSGTNGPQATAMYQYLEENLGAYDIPRTVYLGVKLDL